MFSNSRPRHTDMQYFKICWRINFLSENLFRHFLLILSPYLCLGLASGLFPPPPLPPCAACLTHSSASEHHKNWIQSKIQDDLWPKTKRRRKYQRNSNVFKPLITYLSPLSCYFTTLRSVFSSAVYSQTPSIGLSTKEFYFHWAL
jgi:hypothetical protein